MTIGEFLLELAADKKKLHAFITDPDSYIDKAGLDDDDQRALLHSGHLRELRVKIEAEFRVSDETFMIHFVWNIPTVCIHKPPSPPDPPQK